MTGFLAAAANGGMREALGIHEEIRVVVFGTEGATDPETDARITGVRPQFLKRQPIRKSRKVASEIEPTLFPQSELADGEGEVAWPRSCHCGR